MFNNIDKQLETHLLYNHYPKYPLSFISVCKRAIGYYNRGLEDHMVRLPKGVAFEGKHLVSASQIIEDFHLDEWLKED